MGARFSWQLVEPGQPLRKTDEAGRTPQAGEVLIEDLNNRFHLSLPAEDADTIGGLIMHELGRLPRSGETFEIADLRFKVVRADRRRIETVQVKPLDGKERPVAAWVA